MKTTDGSIDKSSEFKSGGKMKFSYDFEEIGSSAEIFADRNVVIKSVSKTVMKYFAIFAAVILTVILISLSTSKILTYELKLILSGVENGDFGDGDIKSSEFKIIKDYIIKLKKSIEEKNRKKLKLQMYLLNQRITPHFIFNNLSNIKYESSEPNVRGMIDRFILYCRKVFYSKDMIITLKEEIENTKTYLELVRSYRKIDFDIKINTDAECEDIKIPTYILQPIAENAVIHGICVMPDGFEGEIEISGKRLDGFVQIIITDNACMLDENQEPDDTHAVGIIKQIIELYYGAESGSGIEMYTRDGKTVAEILLRCEE